MVLAGTFLALALAVWLSWSIQPAQAQEIDSTPPSVLSIASKDSTFPLNRYGYTNPPFIIGQDILLVVTFDEPVTVTGAPQLSLTIGDSVKAAAFKSVEQAAVTFEYLVAEGDQDEDGISVAADALSLNSGTIRDAVGNHALLNHPAPAPENIYDNPVDGVRPFVENLAITSDPGSDGTYGVGDKIEVTATFNEEVSIFLDVDYSESPPRYFYPHLELHIGDEAKTAKYDSSFGSRGSRAVFNYTVQTGDFDADGISIGPNKLALNGALVKDQGSNLPISGVLWEVPRPRHAVLSHAGIPDDADHKVGLTVLGPDQIHINEDGSAVEWDIPRWSTHINNPTYSLPGNGTGVTWSLTGDDGHLFHLTGSEYNLKKLEFISQPNHEDPLDSDADNIYDVTIQATYSAGTATLNVQVAVWNIRLDADEVPVILGKAQVGKTLEVDPSRIHAGPHESAPTYQWIRNDGATDAEISGATSDSYTLTNDDLGKTVKVRMDMVLDVDNPYIDNPYPEKHVSRTSDATATVVAATAKSMDNSPATGRPSVSGTPAIRTRLTADVSGVADADGLTNVSYRYQWFSNDGTGDVDIGISYAANEDRLRGWYGGWGTSADLWLSSSLLGKTIGVRVTFLDNAGNWETLTSSRTRQVGPLTNVPATGKPTIDGTAQAGETLTADVSGIADANGFDPWTGRGWIGDPLPRPGPGTRFNYQWIRTDGAADTNIAGATRSDYMLVAADVGYTVKVQVSFTDGARYEEHLISAATPVVSDTAALQQANRPPAVSASIVDATIVNESGTHEVSLSDVFDDADGDTLTFIAASSDETKATASLSGDSTLMVTPKARGRATITVTADDGNGGTAEDTFTVTVKAAPGVASAIGDVTGLEAGATQEVSLAGVFSDADGDSLTITATSSDDAKATVTAASDGSKLTLAGVAEGTTTITVTAQDADGNRVSDDFDVTVAKKYAALIAQMYEWRNDPQWVSEKAHTDRWDRALLAFGETVAYVTLTPMAAAEAQGYADQGWERWVEVAAALRELERANPQQEQQQQGTPNQAPTVSSAVGDITIVNEIGTKQVDLSGVFDDADNDNLTITAASSDEAVATVSVATDQSSLTVTAKSRGTATITVTADDGNGGTVDDSFTVTVKAAPVVASAIGDVSGLEAESTQDVSLSGVFSDADGDALSVTATSSDETKATVSVASDGSKLTLAGVAEGTTTITVTAQDSDGNRVSDAFEVEVVNRFASLIPRMYEWRNDPQWVSEKAHTDRWDRALLAFGEEVADKTLTAMTAAEAQEFADMGWERWVEVAKALKEIGGAGQQQQQQVTPNHAPTVSAALGDVTIVNESGTKRFSLSGVFSDTDNDNLTITAASSDETKATVSVASDHSSLTVNAQARGTATITVTASDGNDGSVDDSFTVTVKAAPVVASALADVTGLEVDATQEVSLSGVFSDADGDAPDHHCRVLGRCQGHGVGSVGRLQADPQRSGRGNRHHHRDRQGLGRQHGQRHHRRAGGKEVRLPHRPDVRMAQRPGVEGLQGTHRPLGPGAAGLRRGRGRPDAHRNDGGRGPGLRRPGLDPLGAGDGGPAGAGGRLEGAARVKPQAHKRGCPAAAGRPRPVSRKAFPYSPRTSSDAATAHKLLQGPLQLSRGLPAASGAVPGGVRFVLGRDRPPPRSLSPHRVALEGRAGPSQRAVHDGALGPGRQPGPAPPVHRLADFWANRK